MLVAMLPRPACPDELLAAGSMQSVYGMLQNISAPLEFSQGADGQVWV